MDLLSKLEVEISQFYESVVLCSFPISLETRSVVVHHPDLQKCGSAVLSEWHCGMRPCFSVLQSGALVAFFYLWIVVMCIHVLV